MYYFNLKDYEFMYNSTIFMFCSNLNQFKNQKQLEQTEEKINKLNLYELSKILNLKKLDKRKRREDAYLLSEKAINFRSLNEIENKIEEIKKEKLKSYFIFSIRFKRELESNNVSVRNYKFLGVTNEPKLTLTKVTDSYIDIEATFKDSKYFEIEEEKLLKLYEKMLTKELGKLLPSN